MTDVPTKQVTAGANKLAALLASTPAPVPTSVTASPSNSTSVSLYNKYRPSRWSDVIGHETVVEEFLQRFKDNTVPRFTLFHSDGVPGVGKDMFADLIASTLLGTRDPRNDPYRRYMVLHCKEGKGVGAVRELLEVVKEGPPNQICGQNALWIVNITEIQSLSRDALEALLNIAEHPPAWLYLLATTTNLEAVRSASTEKNSAKTGGSSPLVSRAYCVHLKPIPVYLIDKRLHFIVEAEGWSVADEVLARIAQQAQGSMRSAISLLDQVRYKKTTDEQMLILEVKENADTEKADKMILALTRKGFFDGTSWVSVGNKQTLVAFVSNTLYATDNVEGLRLQLISYINTMLGFGGKRSSPSDGLIKDFCVGSNVGYPTLEKPILNVASTTAIGQSYVNTVELLRTLSNIPYSSSEAELKARVFTALFTYINTLRF